VPGTEVSESLPKTDDEESDRQRQILRYAQDDGLIGCASLRMTGWLGTPPSEPALPEEPGMTG
jgi:hypothetical protein